LMCSIAASHTRSGQHVVYVIGEDHKADVTRQLQAAGANMEGVILVDCRVDHDDVLLSNMLEHRAIAPHLARADALIVDPLVAFESDQLRKHRIRRRLAPFHRLAQRDQHPVTTYFSLHPNKSRARIRNPLDLVPGSWAGDAETVWQIMESDMLGHS